MDDVCLFVECGRGGAYHGGGGAATRRRGTIYAQHTAPWREHDFARDCGGSALHQLRERNKLDVATGGQAGAVQRMQLWPNMCTVPQQIADATCQPTAAQSIYAEREDTVTKTLTTTKPTNPTIVPPSYTRSYPKSSISCNSDIKSPP